MPDNIISKIDVGGVEYNIKGALKYYKKSEVTGVAGTSTTKLSSTYDVTDTSITSYYDGLVISFVLPVAGVSTYGSVFQIGSLGYKPIVYGTSSIVGTRYPVGGQITMVYNSVQTATAYFTKDTKTTVTGCWQVCDYDTSTTDARKVFDYYFRPYAGANAIYRYKLCALDKDNRVAPITLTNQESATQVAKAPTSVALQVTDLWFYTSSSNISASKAVGAGSLAATFYGDNMCPYNFNTSIPAYRMIYLRGTYNSTTGLFTLYNDGSSPCTSYYTAVPNNTANITLSSYFTSGYYYWLVGSTYSTADYLSVFGNNPLYYFDGTNLIPYEQHFLNDKQDKSTLEADVAAKGFTKNAGTVTSVGAGTGLSISGTASVNPTVNIASGYKLPSSAEWDSKQDKATLETDVAAAGFTKNTGTVTSVAVKMNGTTKGTVTSSGTIDLGTVLIEHQDISGKQDKDTLGTDVAALGFTKNEGTVTSVKVQAGAGLTSSQNTAQTVTLDTTIGIASDRKLPTTSEWNAKADTSALTSHTGNSTIHVTSTDKSTWSGKQDALVSGTNIKTINGTSVLGEGNIVTPNDIPNNGVLTMQVNGTQKATFSANQDTSTTFNVTVADLGLSQALVFKGVTTTDLTDGATTSPITMKDGSSLTPAVGNVVLTDSTVATLPSTEFVWADSKWNKLGDAKSYVVKGTTTSSNGSHGHTFSSGTAASAGGHSHTVTATGTIGTGTGTANYTPAGSVSQPTFTGSAATSSSAGDHSHTVKATGTISVGTGTANYTPAGTVSQPSFSNGSAAESGAHSHTVTASGTISAADSTTGNYTPKGTVSQPSFSNGSAAETGDHSHTVTASGSISVAASTTGNYTPQGTVSQPSFSSGAAASNGAHTHSVTAAGTISATASTTGNYTPAGTVSQPLFSSGSAASAGAHTHSVTGTAASAGGHTHSVTGTVDSSGDHAHALTSVTAASSGAHTHSLSGSATSAGAHTHSLSNLPSITYVAAENRLDISFVTATVASAGAHTHALTSVTAASAGAHTHSLSGSMGTTGAHTHSFSSGTAASAGAHTHSTSGTAASSGAHTHTVSGTVSTPTFTGTKVQLAFTGSSVTAVSAGAHTHTVTGTVSQPTFTGTKVQVSFSGSQSTTSTTGKHTHTVTGTVSQPTFTGTKTQLTFSGSSATTNSTGAHTHSVSGTVSQPTFTGTGKQLVFTGDTVTSSTTGSHTHSVTATGTVSKPTFTGTGVELKFTGTSANTSTASGHTHSVSGTVENNGAHTHTVG